MQQHEEFLAAETHHVVAGAHHRAQDACDVAQDAVSSGVPLGVVDQLEVIQVEHTDTDL
jgi:hypothetical protein